MPGSFSYKFDISYSTKLEIRTKQGVKDLLSQDISTVIIDNKVYELYRELFSEPENNRILKLTAGEDTKSHDTVQRIYTFLTNYETDRSTIITVIGGGTITDVAAYAISTYKRGCRLVLIPTTLLGMIDAALGGKTAINNPPAKNQIGSFFPAEQVILVPELLKSLPANEKFNGLAEMHKLRFILPSLTEITPDIDLYDYPELILEYASAKLNICSQDLNDMNQRRLLNLGHTFGHVLESCSDYSISHGEAVIWGIATAARLSEKLALIDVTSRDRIIDNLKQFGFKTELDASVKADFLNKLPALIRQDKKNQGDMLTLILFKEGLSVDVVSNIPLNTVITCFEQGVLI